VLPAPPDFRRWPARIEARIVDLLKPFRAFHCHAPGQNGSASMKAVLPALTARSYDHPAIQEGNTASLEFLRAHLTDVAEAERQRVRRQLEEHCGQDTGMLWTTMWPRDGLRIGQELAKHVFPAFTGSARQ